MASSKEYLQFILEQLSDLEEINYRAMMGEYIIYYRGRIVGGIYDDRLLVKPTKSAVSYMATAIYELPYEGAKEMLLVEDVDSLLKFFNGLNTDKERWDYIEDYFLGYDVLCESETVVEPVSNVEMSKAIDKEKSYPTHQYKKWMDLNLFFDENDHIIVDKIAELGVTIPEYLSTVLKKQLHFSRYASVSE